MFEEIKNHVGVAFCYFMDKLLVPLGGAYLAYRLITTFVRIDITL